MKEVDAESSRHLSSKDDYRATRWPRSTKQKQKLVVTNTAVHSDVSSRLVERSIAEQLIGVSMTKGNL